MRMMTRTSEYLSDTTTAVGDSNDLPTLLQRTGQNGCAPAFATSWTNALFAARRVASDAI